MGKINARTKGKSGEREAINKILQPIVNKVYSELAVADVPVLARNLQQCDSGGYDVIGLAWYAFEIKRCETLNLTRWWAQTTRQAGKAQVPVLLYRQNRLKWRCMLPSWLPTLTGGCWVVADISLGEFELWLELDLTARLTVNNKL